MAAAAAPGNPRSPLVAVPCPGIRVGLVAELAVVAAVGFQIETAAESLWAAVVILSVAAGSLSVVAGSLSVVAGNVAGSTRLNSVPEEQAAAQFEGVRSTVVVTEWRQIQ